jgi:exodeoxyribonuclease VII small subunit
MKDSTKKFNFEDAIKRLEEITDILDKGDLSLDESLKLYEEGIQLKKKCYDYLKKAEGKIFKIVQNNGKEEIEELKEEDILKNHNNDLFR